MSRCWEWQLLWLVGGFNKLSSQSLLSFAAFLWIDVSAIVCCMRRYSLFVTLLLSLLLPLHVAASTLLSAPSCPAKSAMAATDKATPDCCDEDGQMDCQQMQTCHGCNISCQLFSFTTPTFNFTSEKRFYLGITTPFVASFDPASVWRPPTNS